MKRITLFLLAALLAVVLTGCTQQTASEADEEKDLNNEITDYITEYVNTQTGGLDFVFTNVYKGSRKVDVYLTEPLKQWEIGNIIYSICTYVQESEYAKDINEIDISYSLKTGTEDADVEIAYSFSSNDFKTGRLINYKNKDMIDINEWDDMREFFPAFMLEEEINRTDEIDSNSDPNNIITLNNTIELEVPSYTVIDDTDDNIIRIDIINEPYTALLCRNSDIIITDEELLDEDTIKNFAYSFAEGYGLSKMIDYGSVPFNSEMALYEKFTSDIIESEETYVYSVYFNKDDTGYNITLASVDADHEKIDNIFDEIINSIKFI